MKSFEKRMAAALLAGANAAVQLRTVDMAVIVRKDDGAELRTTLTQLPWQLGHGAWVCGVDGVSGGYDCARVRPAPPAEEARGGGAPAPSAAVIKVFRVNDCEWYAAATLAEALAELEECCGPDGEVEEPRELTDEEMDRMKTRSDDDPEGEPERTFREELANLIADGAKFPRCFASTEY